ncbi:IS66 family insertion sequence element accessory protein TnpA [Congregibacter litoralis]|nr:hypothetical protein [Congregibacter litoralis]
MATKPITKRQRYWLVHLKNAASSGGSLVAYAKANDLKPKDLYVWKTQLIKLGHLPASGKRAGSQFVPVVPVSNATSVTLVMPNGFRLQLSGGIDRALLQDLVAVAQQTP